MMRCSISSMRSLSCTAMMADIGLSGPSLSPSPSRSATCRPHSSSTSPRVSACRRCSNTRQPPPGADTLATLAATASRSNATAQLARELACRGGQLAISAMAETAASILRMGLPPTGPRRACSSPSSSSSSSCCSWRRCFRERPAGTGSPAAAAAAANAAASDMDPWKRVDLEGRERSTGPDKSLASSRSPLFPLVLAGFSLASPPPLPFAAVASSVAAGTAASAFFSAPSSMGMTRSKLRFSSSSRTPLVFSESASASTCACVVRRASRAPPSAASTSTAPLQPATSHQ
mmetsp:Transcript_7854/g.20943  ORF Transcript_7854/g.20943 Transcript_7854/m.20943 type:complete len:290 (+) Transcript_7854:934-1803(+)